MTKSRLIPQFLRIHKARIGKHWIWPEHTNTETELVLIKKGRMRCSIDGTEFIAKDGDVYFVQPGQIHYEVILSKHLDIFTLRFNMLNSRGISCAFISDCSEKQQYLHGFQEKSARFLEQILQLIWDEKPNAERKIENVILKLIQLIRLRVDENFPEDTLDKISSRQHILVENAVRFIKENLYRKLTVTEVAGHCCVSACHLTHVFKGVMGFPPIQYIQQQRMDQAKRLLGDESLCVFEVAHQMGYSDPFYFSRQFKKITGFSPQIYRSHIRKAHL
jgi:AraC-like DNA-binding protein